MVGGIGRGIVLAVGKDTVYGGCAPKTSARKNGFSRGDWLQLFLFALLVAVSLTSELFPMVVTACLAKGSAQMGQALFISLFQTGWFLESLWTQVLILQLLRTKRLPFFQSSAPGAVYLVTLLGVLLFTILTFTPFGALFGLTAMPGTFFSFLFLDLDVIFYLLLVTLMKKLYIYLYGSLI